MIMRRAKQGRAEDSFSPALLDQNVHALLTHTTFQCSLIFPMAHQLITTAEFEQM